MAKENNSETLYTLIPPEAQRFLGKLSYSVTGLISLTFLGVFIFVVNLLLSEKMIENDIQSQQDIRLVQEKTMNLLSTQLEMRRLDRSFITEKNKEYVNQYHILANKAMDILMEIRQKNANNVSETIYAELDQNIQAQLQFFELEVRQIEALGLNEKQGLQGQLRKLANNMEVYLTKNPQNPLKKELYIHYLNLRRHEKDFISRLEPKYIEMAQAEVNKIAHQPHTVTPELNRIHADIRTIGYKYMEVLNTFAKAHYLQKDANQKLIESYNLFTMSLNRALNYISDRTALNRQTELQSIQFIKNRGSLLALIFLGLIGLYGIIIIRRIVKAILTKP
jgi:methyl-accepting chemotaxis protein